GLFQVVVAGVLGHYSAASLAGLPFYSIPHEPACRPAFEQNPRCRPPDEAPGRPSVPMIPQHRPLPALALPAGVFLAALLLQWPLVSNPGYYSHDELQWAAAALHGTRV